MNLLFEDRGRRLPAWLWSLCDEVKGTRYGAPWLRNGYVWATDGCLLCRVRPDEASGWTVGANASAPDGESVITAELEKWLEDGPPVGWRLSGLLPWGGTVRLAGVPICASYLARLALLPLPLVLFRGVFTEPTKGRKLFVFRDGLEGALFVVSRADVVERKWDTLPMVSTGAMIDVGNYSRGGWTE